MLREKTESLREETDSLRAGLEERRADLVRCKGSLLAAEKREAELKRKLLRAEQVITSSEDNRLAPFSPRHGVNGTGVCDIRTAAEE